MTDSRNKLDSSTSVYFPPRARSRNQENQSALHLLPEGPLHPPATPSRSQLQSKASPSPNLNVQSQAYCSKAISYSEKEQKYAGMRVFVAPAKHKVFIWDLARHLI